MSGASFTPGPWTFDGPAHNHIVWSGSEQRVCFLTSTGPTTANARLIAAAPDYDAAARDFVAPYAELTEAQLRHAADPRPGTLYVPVSQEVARAVLAFRAVIAKATGEQS